MSKSTLLIIGGSKQDYNLYTTLLHQEKPLFEEALHVENYHSSLRTLMQLAPTCCILADNFHGGSAKELVQELKKFHDGSEFPIVLCIAKGYERHAVDLMRDGIHDYIIQGETTSPELLRVVSNAIRTFDLQNTLKQRAHSDALTGALNRSLFLDRLEQAVLEAQRYQRNVSLMCLDIDHFKQINDTYGHDIGDVILKKVAERIRECVRQSDSVARLGGDEFVVLLPNAPSHTGHYVTQKLLKNIPLPIKVDDLTLNIYPSIGLANFPDTASSHQELLKQADAALYKAKEQGRAQYVKFSKNYRSQWQRKNELVIAFPNAIREGEIQLAYQPIFSPGGEYCRSVEALVRWQHMGQEVSADSIIQLLQQGSMAIAFHEWLFDQTLHQLSQWQTEHPQLKMSINMPANLCHNRIIVESLFDAIANHAIKSDDIILEITENHVMQHQELTKEVLMGLTQRGVLISIDDFGTGYSSMEYLADLPSSQLKIDQRFFIEWDKNEKNQKIAEAINALGHQLGLEVIAEGIETEALANIVDKIGCDGAQGFWLGTPEFGNSSWQDFISRSRAREKIKTKQETL